MYDEAFKGMVVELSYAKGAVQEAARERSIDSIALADRPDHQTKAKQKKS